MNIEGIKNRIEDNYTNREIDEFSSFYISECCTDERGNILINEILPLENGSSYIDISDDLILSDKYGKVLIEPKDDAYYSYKILLVEKNKILISKKKKENKSHLESIILYEYKNGQIFKIDQLFDCTKDKNISLTNFHNYSNILVRVEKENKQVAYLYSLQEGKVISPFFTSLEIVEDTYGKLLKYTDEVESNETLDGNKLKSQIIGYITCEGVLKNLVYSDKLGEVKKINLDTHPNFMQYRAFKNYLSKDLDNDIENDIQSSLRKQHILKNLEYEIKTDNNK